MVYEISVVDAALSWLQGAMFAIHCTIIEPMMADSVPFYFALYGDVFIVKMSDRE